MGGVVFKNYLIKTNGIVPPSKYIYYAPCCKHAAGIDNYPVLSKQHGETNWYGYKVESSIFVAAGDPDKLFYLLKLFK
jgi:hypothetical protein